MPQFEAGNTLGKGRKKGSGRNQVFVEWANRVGVKKLLEIAEEKDIKYGLDKNGKVVRVGHSEALCFDALKLALAYGLGKPTEHVDVTSGGDTFYDFLRGQFPAGGNRVQR